MQECLDFALSSQLSTFKAQGSASAVLESLTRKILADGNPWCTSPQSVQLQSKKPAGCSIPWHPDPSRRGATEAQSPRIHIDTGLIN